MHIIDVIIVVAYLVVLVLIGLKVSSGVKTAEDQMVAGRSFNTVTAAIGAAANSAGGSTSVGGTAYGYNYGLAGIWFNLGTACSMWVAAPFSGRVWKTMVRKNMVSAGEYYGYRFGRGAQFMTNIINVAAYMGFVASQVVATGTICHALLGWNLTVSIIITTLIVILYTATGGLKAVVYTDFMQMAILFIGMCFVLMPLSLHAAGGFGALADNIDPSKLTIANEEMNWTRIIAMIFIPTILNSFTMQAYYGYVGSCKDIRAARNSRILQGFFYIFPALAVIIIGMCALVLFPQLENGNEALPTMILELLPTGGVGLLFAACIAATMSTSDTCLLSSATAWTNIYKDLINPKATTEQLKKHNEIAMVVIGLGVMIVALTNSDIISLITVGYSAGIAGLLVPFFAAFFSKKATNAGALAAMVVGIVGWALVNYNVISIGGLPGLFVSVPAAVVVIIVVSMFTKKPTDEQLAPYHDDVFQKLYPEEYAAELVRDAK